MSWIAAAGKLLNKAIPAGLALKGLSKINPRIGNFIVDATTSGYGADKVLDYLRDRMSSPGSLQERSRLEEQNRQGSLRPDELGSLNKRRESEAVGNGVGVVAGLAGGLGGLLGQGEPPMEQQEDTKKSEETVKPNLQQESLKGATQQKKARGMRQEEEERFNQGYGSSSDERLRQELENNRRMRGG